MDVTVLKVVMLVIMSTAMLFFGLLPLKVLRVLAHRANDKNRVPASWPSLLQSLLSCFAGGVFLGVCLVELLPEANDSWRTLRSHMSWETDYPFVELFGGIGFLMVYLIEELAVSLFPNTLHVHDHDEHDDHEIPPPYQIESAMSYKDNDVVARRRTFTSMSRCSDGYAEPERCADEDAGSGVIKILRHPHAHSHFVRSLTFVAALSLHAILEGFAFGVQEDSYDAIALFFGLVVHKGIVAFSVGMQLARTHSTNVKLVVASIVAFVAMTPIGGAFGIVIELSDIDLETKEILTTLLMSLSVGTFIYITFFEILLSERDNEHPNLIKLAAIASGFILVALLVIASPTHNRLSATVVPMGQGSGNNTTNVTSTTIASSYT